MPGKNETRQAVFQRRMALSEAARAEAAVRMSARFMGAVDLPPAGAVISGYIPVNNEIDVLPLMTDLLGRGYRIAVPHNMERQHLLDFLEWKPDTPLYKGLYGIPQPDPNKAAALVPDLLIVPLVAFDEACNRMGYGSGYFDRTFAHMRRFQHFRAIGVAYEMQKEDRVPTDQYDHRLDAIVTDAAVYRADNNGKTAG